MGYKMHHTLRIEPPVTALKMLEMLQPDTLADLMEDSEEEPYDEENGGYSFEEAAWDNLKLFYMAGMNPPDEDGVCEGEIIGKFEAGELIPLSLLLPTHHFTLEESYPEADETASVHFVQNGVIHSQEGHDEAPSPFLETPRQKFDRLRRVVDDAHIALNLFLKQHPISDL